METLQKTFRSGMITLAGPAVYESLYTAETTTTLRIARAIYDEASSADAGIAFRIGKIGSTTFFGSYTTEVSRSAGAVSNLSLSSLTLLPNETLIIECDGNKTGSGAMSIQIEAHYNIFT
jgi:hypothetical protein